MTNGGPRAGAPVAPDRQPRPVPDGPPAGGDSRPQPPSPAPPRAGRGSCPSPPRSAPGTPPSRDGAPASGDLCEMSSAPLRGRVLRWVPGRIPLSLHAPGKAVERAGARTLNRAFPEACNAAKRSGRLSGTQRQKLPRSGAEPTSQSLRPPRRAQAQWRSALGTSRLILMLRPLRSPSLRSLKSSTVHKRRIKAAPRHCPAPHRLQSTLPHGTILEGASGAPRPG